MTGLVALVIGISYYPKLAATWNIRGDRTANDAIEVTKALVARGVDPKRIKLLLSMQGVRPKDVAGVVPEDASREVLETFIQQELDVEPYVGDSFFLFCSGHGVAAAGQQETLFVSPGSFSRGSKRVFTCLPVERLRAQLQGMTKFQQQFFCINACRTPQEWAMVGQDEVNFIEPLKLNRPPKPLAQARFFSAKELQPAPVEDLTDGFSNGFAKELVECITSGDWPSSANDWAWRLKTAWPSTDVSGVSGFDPQLFKRLINARYELDRGRQRSLAESTLKSALKWTERRNEPDLWKSTLVDLHACTADRLDLLLARLERSVFGQKVVIGGVHRAGRWPSRDQKPEMRLKNLREELVYCLTENRNNTGVGDVVEGLAELGNGVRVVYIEIDGPCQDEKDGPLVKQMLDFWKEIVETAARRVPPVPYLPLLLIGHIDPEPPAGASAMIDTSSFYHPAPLTEDHERRLNRIRGADIRNWLDPIIPEADLRRIDVESELARALRADLIDDIDARMGQILDAIKARAE